ncbi:MAG: hypothetical protein QM724_01240 [Flavobacteriales bacterium]
MFFSFFLIWFLLAILAVTLGSWSLVILFWDKKLIRYIALPIALVGTWSLIAFFTHDPNKSDEALAWQGRHALRTCTSGSSPDSTWKGPTLIVEPDRVCLVLDSLNDAAPVIGRWNYENTEDWTYLELEFPGHAGVQVTGSPEQFSTNIPFPISGCQ